MNNNMLLTENIIIADADYVDSVAFDLTVNFERMLGRRVPQADMARWVECMALDGGMREGSHQTTVILIHDSRNACMKNFAPGHFKDELDGKAFCGKLGEFTFSAVQTEPMADKEQIASDILQLVTQDDKTVKRLMVALPPEMTGRVNSLLKHSDCQEAVATLFTMQPARGGAYRQEMLGYSLMAALGISGKEIEEKLNKTY